MAQDEESDAPVVLSARDVSLRFGGIQALNEVSLAVRRGSISGLIGPNGAGKTSLFNAITRLTDLTSGTITFEDHPLGSVRPRRVIGLGIARTFQNVGIYGGMSVLENVMLGAHHEMGNRVVRAIVRPARARRDESLQRDRCFALLDELGMADVAFSLAGSLPYPVQKRLEIARALASRPKLILLDEPAGGLTHGEVAEFGKMIAHVRDRYGLTVLLIEHHMGLVMSLCDHVNVLHLGKNLADGPPSAVKSDPRVVAAYLGRAA